MKKYKKLLPAGIALAVAVAVIGLGCWCVYISDYPIREDNSNLLEYLTQFMNRESVGESAVKLYDSVDIGNRRIALMEIVQVEDSALGLAFLDRGWNGQYRIDHVIHGSGSLKKVVIASGKQKYVVIGGRNAYFGIAGIEVELHGEKYNIEVPKGDRFLVCTEVDPLTEAGHINWENIRLYDQAGADITDPVIRAGSRST